MPKSKDVVLKIHDGNTIRRLKYLYHLQTVYEYPDPARFSALQVQPKWLWEPELSFSNLHSRIQELFQIPYTEQFVVTCKDKDDDTGIISNSDDVKDVIESHDPVSPLRLQVSLVKSMSESTCHAGDGSRKPAMVPSQMKLPMTATEIWEDRMVWCRLMSELTSTLEFVKREIDLCKRGLRKPLPVGLAEGLLLTITLASKVLSSSAQSAAS